MYRIACQVLIVCILQLLLAAHTNAQCITVDAATPYLQDFEATDGNWIAGGTSGDWEWGHPAKATITGAANGQNCWITGNLNGNAYNTSERSYIVSPCFNFTNLPYPYIEFNVFWEQEYKYDGACFQYSIDNGITWANVGAVNEPANCLTKNWFNYTTISNMTGLGPNKEGWTGTIKPSSGPCSGGNGSGSWLKASHAMSNLAGKTNVKFRFTFGAGTTCNSYDGFAVDDIKIANAPPNTVDFVSNCTINPQVSFTNLSGLCYTNFLWDFGDPSSGAANISSAFNAVHNFSGPGSYTVTLTASGGGGPVVTVAKQIHIIKVKAGITKVVNCTDANNGEAAAVITADPGVNGISYNWNTTPVATTPVISALAPGTYIVSVSSPDACTAKDTLTIINPLQLQHTVVKTDALCGNANGSINITESGGYQPYAYVWSPNIAIGSSAGNLSPNNYIISITDSAGCTDNAHVQIVNTGGLSVSVSNKTDVNCFGGSTGSATATVNGAGGPYFYQWLPSGGTGATAVNLSAGTYKVIATDASGCKDSATVQINQPAAALSAAISVMPATCGISNGTAKVTVAGGVPLYSYKWIPGNYTTDSIYNLSAGTYNVTVTDANGCNITKQADVVASPFPQITSITPTDVTCYGQPTGAALANVNGGIMPFVYTWTNGSNTYTGNPLKNVVAGTYLLTVKDGNGCTASQSVTINQPLKPLQHSVTVNNISCTNTSGSATITATGGTAPYSYLWSPSGGTGSSATGLAAGNYVVNINDQHNCVDTAHVQIVNTSTVSINIVNVVPVSCNGGNNGVATASATGNAPFGFTWSPAGGNSATANNLSAGNYTVMVTDNSGCLSTATVQITEPLPITAVIRTIHTTCGFSNGIAIATAAGGTPLYFYNWMPGNIPGDSINNLSAGAYTVTLTDSKGCTGSGQTVIDPSTSPVVNINGVNTTCNTSNGRASATVISGTPPYNYVWTPGNITAASINNLSPGQYKVTVTDAKSCINSAVVAIRPSTAPVIRSITPVDALCNGKANGSAAAVISGGISPYTYDWTNGPQTYTTASLQNVAAGNYQLTVTDSSGCTDTKTTTIGEPQPMLISVTTTPTTCNMKNASAWVDVIGGTAPYTYLWSSGSSSDTAFNIGNDGVSVDVTDGNGCKQSSGLAPVQGSLPLLISLGNDTIICPGNRVVLYPGKFVAYHWQDNSTDSVFAAAETGTYSVSVVDSMGCNATASIKVETACRDIVFPDAFTPNGDKRNDEFGPLGTLSAISDYSLQVYNRWGQTVFGSTNPFKKWNGKTGGIEPGAGVYVWMASYSFDRKPKKVVKGTVLLIK